MGLKHRSVDPQKGRTSVGFGIYHIFFGINLFFHEKRTELGEGIGIERILQHIHHQFECALARLEENVPGKSVANYDIGYPRKNRRSLDIADEVNRIVIFEQFVGFLIKGASLAFFCPDVQKPHLGPWVVGNPGYVGAAHLGELDEIFGLAIRIGAVVQNGDGLIQMKHGAYGRALYALYPSGIKKGGGKQSPGTAC